MTDDASVVATQESARDVDGKWLPGTPSPNPQGAGVASYPRDWHTMRELARSHVPEAMEKLMAILRKSRSKKIQLAAIALLLDRAWGRPIQPVAVSEAQPFPRENIEPYERARRIAHLLNNGLRRLDGKSLNPGIPSDDMEKSNASHT